VNATRPNILTCMRFISTLLLLCILSACTTPTATLPSPTPRPATLTPSPLTGTWIGSTSKPDSTTASIQITLADKKSTINIEPFTRISPLTFEQNDSGFHFAATGESRDPFKQIDFTGTILNGVLTGEINWDGTISPTTFVPIQSVEDVTLAGYEGVYRFESGRALSIIVSPEYKSGGLTFFSDTLMMTDFDSGALRSLYPTSDASFVVGVLRDVGAPFDGRIEFVRDTQGKVNSLLWWASPDLTSSTAGELATRIEFTIEDTLEFTSQDGTKLIGRLSVPKSDSPIPAFMLLHGSEQGTRDNFGSKVMAHFMLSRGFAALAYDKRGVGDSEGVYQEAPSPANLQRHAEDAIAGVTYLASRPEVDAKRIGLIGGSQAGWVIPLAASQSDAITHLVILSGPVSSTSHENVFSDYTNDGDTITPYDDAKITQKMHGMNPGGFDPVPIVAELKQPSLWLWGSVDKSVPVTFSAENLKALIESGKNNLSYQIFPNGDHNLNESPHGLFNEIPYSPRVLFYSALTQWLAANISMEQ